MHGYSNKDIVTAFKSKIQGKVLIFFVDILGDKKVASLTPITEEFVNFFKKRHNKYSSEIGT